MSYWDRPDAQQALRDRAMDRDFIEDEEDRQTLEDAATRYEGVDWRAISKPLDWEPQPADDDVHATAARPDDPKVPADYCEKCGYRWSTHDTTRADYKPPFGCPDEAQARAAWSGE